MKEVIQVRSNAFYRQTEGEIKLEAQLELVIIHTSGKTYQLTEKHGLNALPKIEETRMIVDPELLQDLITELQLHQKMLQGIRSNADQLNSLFKHLKEETQNED